MLEKFFKDKRATKKHLEAPMLKERDEFLTFKLNQGRSQKRLLSIADYLLIIVEKLNLTDDDYRKVSIQEIEKAATEWSVYKMHGMSTVQKTCGNWKAFVMSTKTS